jgi:hypothetical protein
MKDRMMRDGVTSAGKARRLTRWARLAAVFAVAASVAGCAGASMVLFPGDSKSSDDKSSVGSRFSQIFGSGSDSKAQLVGTPPDPAAVVDPSCPVVAIREGTATYAIGAQGKPATGSDLRFQGTLVSYARDCTRVGGQVNARIGVEGRVIVGPAGAPGAVDLPIRVALVQEGVQPKTIATKLYNTPVNLGESGNVPFSFVAEDFSYPIPAPGVADAYVFYIGFDPNGAKPERPVRKGKKG